MKNKRISKNIKEYYSFKILEGKYPVIISAPHSTLHKRENSIRPKETKTGVLVQKIAKECNISGIYKTKNEGNDANWDKKCTYKEKCKDYIGKQKIRFLLDLHGMAEYREEDICIGINGGNNIFNRYDILEKIIKIFNKNGFNNAKIDKPFNAAYEYCVSAFISTECMIPTFQIEINSKYRLKKYEQYIKYKDLYNSLKEIVEYLKES